MPAQSFISKFYLIINPGLEDLALAELKANLAELENPKKHLGGIEFECDIFKGLELNAKLKIPSRILMRIEEFAASDFPKFRSLRIDRRTAPPHHGSQARPTSRRITVPARRSCIRTPRSCGRANRPSVAWWHHRNQLHSADVRRETN